MIIMEDTVGVLFCGGEGTRMRPYSYIFQKVMMPLGNDQKPILEYIIKHFKNHGIKDLILLVNYKKEQIQGYFGDGSQLGVNIEYVVDKPGPIGTGTALLNAENIIKNRRMIIFYSDIITNVNFSEMLNYHRKHGKLATVLLSKGMQIRVGIAEVNEKNEVTEFKEKPIIPLIVNTGISILEPKVFEYLTEFDSTKSIDLSKDIFPRFVSLHEMMGYEENNLYWEDIGSVERYEKLDHKMISEIMQINKSEETQ